MNMKNVLKTQLAHVIAEIVQRRGLTQVEAGKIMKINRVEVSRIKNGDVSRYTVDRLLACLSGLNHNVDIYITCTNESQAGKQEAHWTGDKIL